MGRLYMNPKGKKRIIASPQDWLTHAKSDLRLAKLGLFYRNRYAFMHSRLLKSL